MSKYNNKKTKIGNITFDSKDEAKFYTYLKQLYPKADIELQPKFELLPKFSYHKEKIRVINYIADFRIGKYVIDVKGVYTEAFKLKAKMFKYKYPELILLVGTSNELLILLKDIKL